jgi:hypothetical protein
MDPQEKILTEGTEAPDFVVDVPGGEPPGPSRLDDAPSVLGEEIVVPAPEAPKRLYPSLYDTKATTVAAILLGIAIVASIQYAVARMYQSAKNEQEYLTRFVTGLVGLVMGAYIADLLIAGPDTSLLSPEEHLTILGFVKDVCLMVFAYFFGTKSAASSPSTPPSE